MPKQTTASMMKEVMENPFDDLFIALGLLNLCILALAVYMDCSKK